MSTIIDKYDVGFDFDEHKGFEWQFKKLKSPFHVVCCCLFEFSLLINAVFEYQA